MAKKTIGEKIVELRKARGITQSELGTQLNVSYQAVSKWERGEACPDFATISKIAQYFGVSITHFEESVQQEQEPQDLVAAKAEAVEEKITCPFCGKETRVGKFCDHCDGYLGLKTKAEKKKQVVGEIVCSSCKRKIPANNILCPYCRNMVGTGKAKIKNKSNVNGWAIAAIILSGGLVGFILGIIGYNKSTETGRGRGLSLAAIVISILGMILGAVLPIILYSRGGVFDNLLGLYS